MITLKLATSLDGRIATAGGESRWITGEAARHQVHRLRAAHDAVLIGAETALADDPELTVRLPGYEGPQPARVILDSRQRLPLDSRLARGAAEVRTIVVSTGPARPDLAAAGVQVVEVPDLGEGRPDLTQVVAALRERGLARIFVEGGGQVAASFLRCGLVAQAARCGQDQGRDQQGRRQGRRQTPVAPARFALAFLARQQIDGRRDGGGGQPALQGLGVLDPHQAAIAGDQGHQIGLHCGRKAFTPQGRIPAEGGGDQFIARRRRRKKTVGRDRDRPNPKGGQIVDPGFQ